MRWSDPFEQLSVGERFDSRERIVRDTDVIVFSALTGDWHPQHCDSEWAASSPFGERIAHGMLVLSLAVGLVPLDPERVVALRRVGDVVFKRPVALNDAIRVSGQIAALRPIDESSGLVDFAWRIHNQDDALVARASVAVVWRCGPLEDRSQAPAGLGRIAGCATREAGGSWHEQVAGSAHDDDFVPLPL